MINYLCYMPFSGRQPIHSLSSRSWYMWCHLWNARTVSHRGGSVLENTRAPLSADVKDYLLPAIYIAVRYVSFSLVDNIFFYV